VKDDLEGWGACTITWGCIDSELSIAQLVYTIHSSWIGEIAKALADHANAAFALAIDLVVVGVGHQKLDLKVLHELLP
jgi:hypothetical protein